ncbi:acyl-CoA carboxylase subunit epsilon [Streptomyces caatingaensis]|uniref:Uncharacterized protein n=1 Tax=Streptomyces caatingaensis TaxID=1678637 RepID=A0A0K9X702_9ACTN|nr:hypothetical protein AC230_28235 [Streptomyces caatingaensis]
MSGAGAACRAAAAVPAPGGRAGRFIRTRDPGCDRPVTRSDVPRFLRCRHRETVEGRHRQEAWNAMDDPLVRVEKGAAGREELAAVTAVLLACAAAGTGLPLSGDFSAYGLLRTPAHWHPSGFASPISWRHRTG